MTSLPERFHRHLAALRLPDGPVVAAVSGGPDSIALLHLLVAAMKQEPFAGRLGPVTVGHVDHGIHPESAALAARVRRTAEARGLACLVVEARLGPGASETAAREARYRALFELARDRGALLFTAHHRDDQAETVLLRVLGGSGPAGLAAMNAVSGILVRPLLPFSRAEIAEWLATLGAQVWEDPANVDPRHLRSWLRTEILPRLRAVIPAVDRRLERVARLARTERAAWDALLDILPLDLRLEGGGVSIRQAPLSDWPLPLGMQLLQAAARRAGFTLGPLAAARVLALVRQGHSGRRADLGHGLVAECAFDRISLGPPHPAAPFQAVISGAQGRVETGGWGCEWRPEPAPERQARAGWVAWLPPGEYAVRPWKPGDRIVPLGGVGSRLVVRCLQEARIARRERPVWPVVTVGGEILWVPGITRSSQALPAAGSPALRLEFSRR